MFKTICEACEHFNLGPARTPPMSDTSYMRHVHLEGGFCILYTSVERVGRKQEGITAQCASDRLSHHCDMCLCQVQALHSVAILLGIKLTHVVEQLRIVWPARVSRQVHNDQTS